MPSVVGPIHIANVGGGTVQFGDAVIISPKSNQKTVTGAGSLNTAVFAVTNNGINLNNVLDTKLIDQPTIGNN
jgi:spore germination protein PF